MRCPAPANRAWFCRQGHSQHQHPCSRLWTTRRVSCRRNAAYSRGRIRGHSRFRPGSQATDQVRYDFRHRLSSLLPRPRHRSRYWRDRSRAGWRGCCRVPAGRPTGNSTCRQHRRRTTGQMWDRRLQRIKSIVHRQQPVPPECDDDRLYSVLPPSRRLLCNHLPANGRIASFLVANRRDFHPLDENLARLIP